MDLYLYLYSNYVVVNIRANDYLTKQFDSKNKKEAISPQNILNFMPSSFLYEANLQMSKYRKFKRRVGSDNSVDRLIVVSRIPRSLRYTKHVGYGYWTAGWQYTEWRATA